MEVGDGVFRLEPLKIEWARVGLCSACWLVSQTYNISVAAVSYFD